MPGGAGARRGPPHLDQNPYQGDQYGPPAGYNQQFNQYQAGPQPQQQYSGPPASQQGLLPDKPRSGGFDGPGEPSRGPNPYGPGLGYDPAKPQVAPAKVITNTRVELPAAAYKLEGGLVSWLTSFFYLVFWLRFCSGCLRVRWCFARHSSCQEVLDFQEEENRFGSKHK
jgi:hypothetical protein